MRSDNTQQAFVRNAYASAVSAETISYAYDAAGRLTHAYYQDRSIEYVYDPAGHLLQRIVTAGVSPSSIEPTMRAGRSGGDLAIAYSTDACVSADHALFVGTLADFGALTAGIVPSAARAACRVRCPRSASGP